MEDQEEIVTKGKKKVIEKKSVVLNDELDLSEFDYSNLNGESFRKYEALVNSLPGQKKADFIQVRAYGIHKKKQDDQLRAIPYVDGLIIKDLRPINTTRIEVRYIRDLNRQIENPDTPDTNSRYYLLKKPD